MSYTYNKLRENTIVAKAKGRRNKSNVKILPRLPERTFKILGEMEGARFNSYSLVTPQQMTFVRQLFVTGRMDLAFKRAKYVNNTTSENYQRIARLRVFHGQGVQWLIKVVMADFIAEQQLTANNLAKMTLQAYDNATNVRDQLNALKLLSSFLGHDTKPENCQ